VYFVRSGSSWVLIDTGMPHRGELIRRTADALFAADTRPAAILLTHLHADHAGSARELKRIWNVPVYVHPDELPLAPFGRVIAVLTRLERRWLFGSLAEVVSAFDPSAGVPGLADWRCIPTPGHTPGHISLFRDADRVLITGDAVLTINPNSFRDLVRGTHTLGGAPRIVTWDWWVATRSIATLAQLEPRVLAPGHGRPMATGETATALRAFAERLGTGSPGEETRSASHRRRLTDGFLRPVDYSSRTRYRRPPATYLRVQWLGSLLITLGVVPANVIVLEVPGRRSGVIRRTTLVRTACDGADYLVALAGESEWVRNVRAAGGRVVLGRRTRYAARLVELPPDERAPVIRAYLLRGGRRAGSKAAANEARYFFGVSAHPALSEIRTIAPYYPVFRVLGDRDQHAADAGLSAPAPA